MRLNADDKKDMRKYIEKRLAVVSLESTDKRLPFKKDYMEDLIFSIVKNPQTGEKEKRIVWSGEFLRKIDLSEISFDGVQWAVKDQNVDLSGTNAVIDFSKAAKSHDIICVEDVNLNGVDLSGSHTDLINQSTKVDYRNTNAKFNLNVDEIGFKDCNLDGLDLEGFEVDSDCFDMEAKKSLYGSSFKNTGIKIILTADQIKKDKEARKENDKKQYDKNLPEEEIQKIRIATRTESIANLIYAGKLNGCYVNETLIMPQEQKDEEKPPLIEEYKAFIQSKVTEFNQMLEDAITSQNAKIVQSDMASKPMILTKVNKENI